MIKEIGVSDGNVFDACIESVCRANSFDEGWLKDNKYYIRDMKYLENDNIHYKNNIILSNMCYHNRSFFKSCKKSDFTDAEIDLIQVLLCLECTNIDEVISDKDCIIGINLLYSKDFKIVYDRGSIKIVKDCYTYDDIGISVNQLRNILLYTRLLIES